MAVRGPLAVAFDAVEDGLAIAAGAMIVFAMLAVTTDVVLRLFNMSLSWSFEVTEFILVYIPLLTLPWLARRRAHIVIDIVTSRLSVAAAAKLSVLTSTVAALISLVVTYWGAVATATAFNRGIVNAGLVEYPRWALLVAIPVGFGLAAIEFARIAATDAKRAW